LTLAGDFLAGVNLKWKVSNKIATGDHNIILFTIGSCRAKQAVASIPWVAAFNLRRVDWSRLRELIRSSLTVEVLEVTGRA